MLMNTRWPRILGYHSISRLNDDPNMMCTSPERFESQMLYLKRRNLRGVSVRELLKAWDTGSTRGLVGLTFDDGYEDFLHTALPMLERLRFSATVFAVGAMLGGENDWKHFYTPKPRIKLLGAAGIREISERGVEVGAHSMSHPVLPSLVTEELEKEVSDSRRILSELLGEDVEGFCYPYGILDHASIQAVRRAGYAYACAGNTRVEGTIHDLPRTPVADRDNLLRFSAKLMIHAQYRAAKRIYYLFFQKSEQAPLIPR